MKELLTNDFKSDLYYVFVVLPMQSINSAELKNLDLFLLYLFLTVRFNFAKCKLNDSNYFLIANIRRIICHKVDVRVICV